MPDVRARFDRHYSARVAAFVASVGEIDAAGIPEPHIPLFGTGYEAAALKIGIIGRDTRGWGDMNNFLADASLNPTSASRRHEPKFNQLVFTQWTNSFGTTFWDTAFRILAGIHGAEDWRSLKRGESETILRSFFWANTNSVEKYGSTPKKRKVSFEVWQTLKNASEKHFDSLEGLLEVFIPDIVILLNWRPGKYFLDSGLTWSIFGNHLSHSVHPTYGTHIIRSAHPTWMSRKKIYTISVAAIIAMAKKIVIADSRNN